MGHYKEIPLTPSMIKYFLGYEEKNIKTINTSNKHKQYLGTIVNSNHSVNLLPVFLIFSFSIMFVLNVL